MYKTVKCAAAYVTVLAILFCVSPLPSLAALSGARLEGLVVGVDGRPAGGSTVYLVSSQGEILAESITADDGVYSFAEVPGGDYMLAIRTADGELAPVAAPPVRLTGGELARRDLKMVQADPETVSQAVAANYGFGSWWGSLSGGGKVGVIIAFIAVGYGLYEWIDDDDEKEPIPSPYEAL